MKLWLDDWRAAPGSDYTLCRSVNEAKQVITLCEEQDIPIELISCDYDLGEYENDGGPGLALLDWLSQRRTFYTVEVHSTHWPGAAMMKGLIDAAWPK